MCHKRNAALSLDETVIDIIRPSGVQHFVRVVLGFFVITANTFFTFWLWQRGLEGQIFYVLAWVLGVYIIFYGTLFNRSNYLIVTDARVLDVHRESLFNETISALPFIDMSDVVFEQRGVLASLFNYGVLTLYPREGKFRFVIDMVPKPAKVQNFLLERREAARVASRLREKSEVYKRLVNFLPEFSEAELTLLYQKVHSQLLCLAHPPGENHR